MVVFNCNACGEALKKNQVEKHYQQQCRRCEVLSCVDCGKEFWGNDYEQHTKCISEEEKYSGKNFKLKPNANKGEQKQELWTQQVQAAVAKVTTNAKLKGVLQQLTDFPNIPRKKAKFENFLRNSFRVYDTKLAADAWDAISAELSKQEPASKVMNDTTLSKSSNGHTPPLDTGSKQSGKEEANGNSELAEDGVAHKKKLKSKHKKDDVDDKDLVNDLVKGKGVNEDQKEDADDDDCCKEKKRKRKLDKQYIVEDPELKQDPQEPSKKKKKSKDTAGDEDIPADSSALVVESPSEFTRAVGSFMWEAAIVGVLKRAPDNQLKLSKLRKKVLAEFNARGGDGKIYSEEKLLSKFTKKVNNSKKFKLTKDLVKLVR